MKGNGDDRKRTGRNEQEKTTMSLEKKVRKRKGRNRKKATGAVDSGGGRATQRGVKVT